MSSEPKEPRDAPKGPQWSSLEIAKLVVGLATPLLILGITLYVNSRFQAAQQAYAEQEAIRVFSEALYGRRARAELLASALRRHSQDPTDISLEEVKARKVLYDESYYGWNASNHANLLLVRRILEDDVYSEIERTIEVNLVGQIFSPLDACLTKAYDLVIRDGDGRTILEACDYRDLLRRSLDCGYEIADTVFLVSYRGIALGDQPYGDGVTYREEIRRECG